MQKTESAPISILFKDQNWLVVDKPCGLSVHNPEDSSNLMKTLCAQLMTLSDEKLKIKDLYPVHRLDKETSGVQIFALNKSSAQSLAEEFQNHRVNKIYWGLVKGVPQPETGLWNKPLTDKAEGRKSPQGLSKNRVECATEFTVIKRSPYLSLCEFRILTGRQHQIRKHAALAKHPLIGDPRYGSPSLNKKIKEIYNTDRMYLHCMKIELSGTKLKSKTIPVFDNFFKKV